MGGHRSLFVTFEGGEGCGKSTQIKLLSQTLLEKGLDVAIYREPGGTQGAEEIRSLLLSGIQERWTPKTEALLMSASRADLVQKCILPHLEKGGIVLCDRFTDSTLAYQGIGHGLGYDAASALNHFTVGSLKPDLTFIFQLDPVVGLERTERRGAGKDRYESFDLSFHKRVQEGYAEILKRNPDRCVAVDALLNIEALSNIIAEEVYKKL